jgi:transcriptional regulator with XRE-family HTH domain
MMNTELFHQRLERLRREKKLTAKAMARLIDVAESTYREWENGRGMRLPPFQKMSQVLAISVTELITGDQPAWADVTEQLKALEKNIAELRINLSSRI